MLEVIPTRRRQFTMYLDFVTQTPERIRVVTRDANKANTIYSDRIVQVNGKRQIFISFPITPYVLSLDVYNLKHPNTEFDPTFKVVVTSKPLLRYDIVTDDDTREFLEFNNWFCENAGILSATRPDGSPSIYKSKTGKFTIKYFDAITSGNIVLNTPARVGHDTGNIEVSASHFRKYTIFMRHIILDHEFSHKYRNEKTGSVIEDEIMADINALYFYLGMGFSKLDAMWVYTEVFYKAQSQDNMKRMAVIYDYIKQFENERFAKKSEIDEF